MSKNKNNKKMKLNLIFLFLSMIFYGQKRDTIIYNGDKYMVEKVVLFYQDTVYVCDKNTNFRFTKDTIYVYKPKYYKKIKRIK
jgi:hypothetical protein